jgi:polyisoprenoid-binding protein YceI
MRPLLLSIFLLAHNANAQTTQTLQLDAARSHATFEVKVLYLIGLHGEFGSVHGTLSIDRARGLATVDAVIDTNAVHMRNRRYENWTKSAEFFDAQHFPQIHFVSSPFALARLTDGGRIEGALTIRGTSKPAAFDIDPAECKAPLGGTCAVAASGTIRRSEFGMHSRRGTLADKVDLDLSIFVHSPSQ